MQKYVTVIGGINVDIKGYPSSELIPETSNPGRVYMSPGGVGRNIAHNLALLGVPVYLLGAVGDDGFGHQVLNSTKEAGVYIDTVRMLKQHHTGTYLSVLDDAYDLAVAVSDMEITHYVDHEYIHMHRKLIEQSCFVVLETNLDKNVLDEVVNICKQARVPCLIEPVSLEKAKKLRAIARSIDYITPNILELGVLYQGNIELPEQLETVCSQLRKDYKNILVTLGEKGVYYQGNEGSGLYPSSSVEVVDVNGAGDAFVAGFVCGLFHQYAIQQCIRFGIAAARVTLQSAETVSKAMSFETCFSLIQ